MPFDKVREVLVNAHKMEQNGEGKKKLAKALDLMKQAADHKDLANEGNASNNGNAGDIGDDGGVNSKDPSPAALSEKPALKISDSERLHTMPMKDLEAHVKKGFSDKTKSGSNTPTGESW